MSGPLPEDWRAYHIRSLRKWVTEHPERPPYVSYMRKQRLVEWIEKYGQP